MQDEQKQAQPEPQPQEVTLTPEEEELVKRVMAAHPGLTREKAISDLLAAGM